MTTQSQKNLTLKDRAHMLAQARNFFNTRSVIEVDCNALSPYASVDAHIDLMHVPCMTSHTYYLHSSPEYAMKKLIVDGIGDIFQLSHVFRDNEQSQRHRPEFMMAEWYRLGFTFDQMIQETVDFVKLFIGEIPTTILTYREAFNRYTGFDYHTATETDLINYLKKIGITPHYDPNTEGKDDLLNIILGTIVEPQIGQNDICVIKYFPASQAALAKTHIFDGEPVAERFEIFHKGYELANGYHELADAGEQLKRLQESNEARIKFGKSALPIDIPFIEALKKGLPDCCGVAVGFDRLMMLRHNTRDIADVIADSIAES